MTVDCNSNGTDVGDAIVAIWADILGSADVSLATDVSLTTNVLEAGANSIHLLLAHNRIRDVIDDELDPASIFAHPVIGDFVAMCMARKSSEQMEEFEL